MLAKLLHQRVHIDGASIVTVAECPSASISLTPGDIPWSPRIVTLKSHHRFPSMNILCRSHTQRGCRSNVSSVPVSCHPGRQHRRRRRIMGKSCYSKHTMRSTSPLSFPGEGKWWGFWSALGGCSHVDHVVSSYQVNKPNDRKGLVYGRDYLRDYRKEYEDRPLWGDLRKCLFLN